MAENLLRATPYKLKITSSPPKSCPRRCYEYISCETCLESLGSEGGDQECEWSVQLQQVGWHGVVTSQSTSLDILI